MKRRYLVFSTKEAHIFGAVLPILASRTVGFTAEYDGLDMYTIRFESSDKFFKLLSNSVNVRYNECRLEDYEEEL